jgi:hypothetical protein
MAYLDTYVLRCNQQHQSLPEYVVDSDEGFDLQLAIMNAALDAVDCEQLVLSLPDSFLKQSK